MVIGSFWIIVVFVGAFALGGAILWAMANNRTSKRKLEQTEQATRDLYDGDTADRRSH
jgi:hypothetical protein